MFLLSDQKRLSNGDEAGGGHRFVLLLPLITPWGISVVPFSSCSVLISLLPADSSLLIIVFMLTCVTRSKNIVFLGVIMQKQINVLSNEWSYLVKDVNLNCHTRCCFCNLVIQWFFKKEIQPTLTMCCWLQTCDVSEEDSWICWYFQASFDASSLSDIYVVKRIIIMAPCGRSDNHQSTFILMDTEPPSLQRSIFLFSLWRFPFLSNTAHTVQLKQRAVNSDLTEVGSHDLSLSVNQFCGPVVKPRVELLLRW